MSSFAYKQNIDLDLSGKIALVAGGTQGIGAATAIRFAVAGASVYITGRNALLGATILEQLEKNAKNPATQKFEFIQADTSLVSEVKKLASTLTGKAGTRGIDYLVNTAGGLPSGVYGLTSEGHEKHLAVQVLGRFGLAYLLAKAGTLKESALTICAPAGKDGPAPNVDDLELAELAKEKKFTFGTSMTQDSALLDAFTAQFAVEFPAIRTMHAFPGLVSTNVFANGGVSLPLRLLWNVLSPIVARTIGNTAQGYAEIPVYLTSNPKSKASELRFFDNKLKDAKSSWIEEKPEVAKAAWDKLAAIFDA